MDSPITPLVSSPTLPAALPTFAAGITLTSLDNLYVQHPSGPAAGARQTLKCTAVAVRLMGRGEDEAAVRDAILLTAVGGDSEPAGRVPSLPEDR